MYLIVAGICIILLVALFFLYKIPISNNASFFTNILLGHRGARAKNFPFAENSFSSAEYSMEHGSQGIEFDVMLSKDGVPIVFHDTNTMNRVCLPIPHFSFSDKHEACVPTLTLEQIKQYRYNKGPENEEIPTLEEYIQYIEKKDPNQILMIELKEYERSREMAIEVNKIFAKYPTLCKRATVASFNPVILYMIRKMNSKIVTNFLFMNGLFADWFQYDPEMIVKNQVGKDYPQFIKNLHEAAFDPKASVSFYLAYRWLAKSVWFIDYIYFLCCVTWIPCFIGAGVLGFYNQLALDLQFVKRLQRRGYVCNVWVVNDEKQKQELKSLGNVAITTDILFDK